MQELYNVEHFAVNTLAITFWRLPAVFVVMFLARGKSPAQACCKVAMLTVPA